MTDQHASHRYAHKAGVDRTVFARLEPLLAHALTQDSGAVDLGALGRLVAANPIETGPWPALGSRADADDLRERLDILRRVYPAVERLKNDLEIEASLLPETFEIYIPLARFMADRSRDIRAEQGRAAVFGINGGQGSGKTTINAILQTILSDGFHLKTAGFSLDDVYKTYAQRQEMGRTVHPLFAIRSVAGTHDTGLAMDVLDLLVLGPAGGVVRLPRFDKMAKGGQGDRLPEAEWPQVETPVDVVIFEGWCVGAPPQHEAALRDPVNAREARDDPKGLWRATMNRLLATDYKVLFDRLDELLVIQVRSMEDVFLNRELQEQHLRRHLAAAKRRGGETGDLGAMSPKDIVAFISLFERTTRSMLEVLPERARITLFLGDAHRITDVRVNADHE